MLDSLAHHATVADNVEQEVEERRTFGERAADHVAQFGGSWTFLIIFGVGAGGLDGCQCRDGIAGLRPLPVHPAEPGLVGAWPPVQAPVIMMSQRRTEAKGPCPVAERLPGEPEGGTGDPAPAREDGPPDDGPVGPAGRAAADPDRTDAREMLDRKSKPAAGLRGSATALSPENGAPSQPWSSGRPAWCGPFGMRAWSSTPSIQASAAWCRFWLASRRSHFGG